jgi:mRNA interferase RelE/StbE
VGSSKAEEGQLIVYTIHVPDSAIRSLKKLPKPLQERLLRAAYALEGDPRSRGAKKLAGHELYRIRVGDYRIVYSIDDPQQLVKVTLIAHRREVYRDL